MDEAGFCGGVVKVKCFGLTDKQLALIEPLPNRL